MSSKGTNRSEMFWIVCPIVAVLLFDKYLCGASSEMSFFLSIFESDINFTRCYSLLSLPTFALRTARFTGEWILLLYASNGFDDSRLLALFVGAARRQASVHDNRNRMFIGNSLYKHISHSIALAISRSENMILIWFAPCFGVKYTHE